MQFEEKFNNKKLANAMHLHPLVNALSYLTLDFFFFFSHSNIHFFGIEVEFLSNFLKWIKVLNEKQRYPL